MILNLFWLRKIYGIGNQQMELTYYGLQGHSMKDVGKQKELMIYLWFLIGIRKGVPQDIPSKLELVIKSYWNHGF